MSNGECSYYGRTAFLSFLVGAAAGAAAVLFLAPRARRESAERIRRLSYDLRERATDTVESAREKVASTVGRGRDFLDEKRSVIESAVEAGKAAYAQGKSRAS